MEDYDYDTPMGLTDSDKEIMEHHELVERQANALIENPFDKEQYLAAKGSDQPIQYPGGMADMLLSNDEYPDILRKKYFNVFNRDVVLTFADENTKAQKILSFDISLIDNMNGMDSYFDYTFKDETQYGIIRNILDTKLDRAKGTTGNTKNERIILQSQFNENRQISEVGQSQGPIKEGFFKRLLGRR